jgi:hypothetical protein
VLLTLFVILLILWGLGMLTAFTLGGVIHILLIFALISIVLHFFRRRRLA